MRGPKNSLLHCSFFFLLFLAARLPAQPSRLRPLQTAEAIKVQNPLDKSLLPDGAETVRVDPSQSFTLRNADKMTGLKLFSLHFQVPRDGVQGLGCGVYLLQPGGKAAFFNPVSDDIPVVCEGIVSVRLRRDVAGPPGFLFRGSFTVGSRAWRHDFLISWDRLSGKYTLDTTGT